MTGVNKDNCLGFSNESKLLEYLTRTTVLAFLTILNC